MSLFETPPTIVANPNPAIPAPVVKAEIQIPPTTTTEQNLKSAGQRKINLIWEYSQAVIALLVVLANVIYIFATLIMFKDQKSSSELLANAFFLVIGFYFGRTNHARVGDTPIINVK